MRQGTMLRRAGGLLMVFGLPFIALTIDRMIRTAHRAQEAQVVSANAFAEGIDASLVYSRVGAPLLVAGLALFVWGWIRSRREQRRETP